MLLVHDRGEAITEEEWETKPGCMALQTLGDCEDARVRKERQAASMHMVIASAMLLTMSAGMRTTLSITSLIPPIFASKPLPAVRCIRAKHSDPRRSKGVTTPATR